MRKENRKILSPLLSFLTLRYFLDDFFEDKVVLKN